MQGIYDFVFSYPHGDTRDVLKGSIAAGVTLRLAEELAFGYRDAPIFKMMAGMGDTIFTPMHDALVTQGVTISLFHAVTDVAPSRDGAGIDTITLRRQAAIVNPPYDPFVWVKGRRCWPRSRCGRSLSTAPNSRLKASGSKRRKTRRPQGRPSRCSLDETSTSPSSRCRRMLWRR